VVGREADDLGLRAEPGDRAHGVKPVWVMHKMALAPVSSAARHAALVIPSVTVSSMWGCMVEAISCTRAPQAS
jgi:hypothetical protein